MDIPVQQVMVGPQVPADGQLVYPRAGQEAQTVVAGLHGNYYEHAMRGNIWTAMSAIAGVTPPIYSNTAQVFGLWNQSTNMNLELIELTLSSVGTPSVSGNLGFAIITGAGQDLGTPITAKTIATGVTMPLNSRTLLPGIPPAGKYCTALTVLAPTVYLPVGLSSAGVLAAGSTSTPWVILSKQFDGTFIVPPGVCICLCGNVAQTQPFGVTLSWIEVPILK